MTDLARAIELNRGSITGALELLPPKMDSIGARVMLIAIAGQEASLIHQAQIGGPARGLQQFERGGGVKGVMTHPASKYLARSVCQKLGIAFDSSVIMDALAKEGSLDRMDFAFGRLLLWTEPKPLPKVGDEKAAWYYYEGIWRPGRPRPESWHRWYQIAMQAVA